MMVSARVFIVAFLSSVLLAACGGGGGGGGDASDPVADTSPPTIPQAVTAAAISDTQVDISWSASTDVGGGTVSGYKVYRNGVLVTLVSVTSYSDNNLSANTAYSYTVSAYDDAVPSNESAQSSPPVSVTTLMPPDTDPPTVPQNVTAVAPSQTQVDVGWDASTDVGGGVVAGYKVFRNGVAVADVTSGTAYSDTGLTANTGYNYSVSAYDDAVPLNESAPSSPPVGVITPPLDTSPPTVPLNLAATASGPTGVNLDWTASTDTGGGVVAGYNVYRDGALVASVTVTGYSDSGLTANTSYNYTVSAFDDALPANESAQSAPPVTVKTEVDPGFPITYTFSTPVVSDWSTLSDTGMSPNWQVSSGEYRQDIDVADQSFGVPFDQSYKLGTYSYLPALGSMTGYRFRVDITPLRDLPARDPFDGQDVGVMFRYQGPNNYYRLSFSTRESFARLEKKVGGVFTTLATNARGYIEEQTFTVDVNISGDLIQVKRDGDPVFAVSDPDLSSGTVALYCQDAAAFDNVLIDVNDPNPTLVVSTPLAHSVQAGTAVTGSAAVTNMPAGGSVEFQFGGAPCATATESSPGSGFYTADCGNAAQGDYFLTGDGLRGLLLNSSGGAVASDQNLRVGIQGDQYVAVGDSITLGTYDLFSGDNQSTDGRVIGQQGYQAELSDQLTVTTGYPNMVFNDGIGGDETPTTLARIDSILERHPGSNRMLMMLGTNDSGGGTPLGQAAYQANMQSLVDTMTGQGKAVWVAKVPPVLPDASNAARNTIIQGYNTAIESLTGNQAGPDFYAFFYDNNGTPGTLGDDYERLSLYFNSLHPNALGIRIMAYLWHNALTGSGTTLPLFLDRLCNRLVSATCAAVSPTNHKQNLLETGYPAYVDEIYTLTAIPPALADGVWIQTANAESGNTAASYIDFIVDRPVTVYVAYDAGATSAPGWLTGTYANTGLTIQTTDPGSPTLDVFSRNFAAGTVSLGGNLASGASGADSNYLAIVIPQ